MLLQGCHKYVTMLLQPRNSLLTSDMHYLIAGMIYATKRVLVCTGHSVIATWRAYSNTLIQFIEPWAKKHITPYYYSYN